MFGNISADHPSNKIYEVTKVIKSVPISTISLEQSLVSDIVLEMELFIP